VADVTALRAAGRGRTAVELDGAPWRVVPTEIVLRLGLRVGRELDRPLARELGRELRRSAALGRATRALRYRDFSRAGLDERLERAGAAPAARREVIETLERAGLVDDERVARGRTAALAGRGYGDAAIRHDLERQGLSSETADAALAALEPEAERARRIAEARGGGPKTARYLAGKGFGEDAIEGIVADEA